MRHTNLITFTLALIVNLIAFQALHADWLYNGSDTITETGDNVVTPWTIYVSANGEGYLQLKQKSRCHLLWTNRQKRRWHN